MLDGWPGSCWPAERARAPDLFLVGFRAALHNFRFRSVALADHESEGTCAGGAICGVANPLGRSGLVARARHHRVRVERNRDKLAGVRHNVGRSVRPGVGANLRLIRRLHARGVPARRLPDVVPERGAERTRRAVAHAFRDLGQPEICPAEQILRDRHPPSEPSRALSASRRPHAAAAG